MTDWRFGARLALYFGAAIAIPAAGLTPLLLPDWLDFGFGFFGFWIGAAVILPLVYLRKHFFGEATGPPGLVLKDVAHRLRSAGYRVDARAQTLTVRVTTSASVKIHARPSDANTAMYYQCDETPEGWSWVVILFIFIQGIGALIFALYHMTKIHNFVTEMLVPQLPKGGEPRPLTDGPAIRAELIDGLSESHRLAAEAYEAAHSRYEDVVVILWIVGMALWLTGFVYVELYSGLNFIKKSPLDSFLLSTVAILATFVPAHLLHKRRVMPGINNHKAWADELRYALEFETSRIARTDDETSHFELVLRACDELPNWLEARRKGALSREAGTSLMIMLVGYISLWFFISAFAFLMSAPLLALMIVSAGVVLAVVAYTLYRKMVAAMMEEKDRLMSEWHARVNRTRAMMDQYLKDL